MEVGYLSNDIKTGGACTEAHLHTNNVIPKIA